MNRLPLLLLLLAGCNRPAPPVADAAPPPPRCPDANLVFVSFDALQAKHVGVLGNPRDVTPTFDSMARSGYLFTQARSVASWTVPASMTWFTGVYPSEHRMVNKFAVYQPPVRTPANLKELAPTLVTLAEVLRANGYATGGFTGNAGVSGGFGYEQGFDTYVHDKEVFGGFDQSIPRALDWLKGVRGRKFFLFLHGYDIHGQNTPAGGFDYRFVDKGYDGRFTGSEREQEALREEGLAAGRLTLRDADVRFWRAVYDEKVARTDALFRDFLAEYDRLGLMANTLFVLTADHGTELLEHHRLDHGFTLYDETVRVPLVLKLPGQTAGRVIDHRVGSIDLMPTILDLLAVPPSDRAAGQMRGTSLVPALVGGRVERDMFAETDYRAYTFKRSVVTPAGFKYVHTLETGGRELYDLTADPGETTNLAATQPTLAGELQAKLFAHFKAIGHDLTAKRWEPGLNPVYRSQGR